tara:strand:+ start:2143 stop:3081 length:939 start_codon:yes stop_codon:yes gene_type:complete
MFKKIFLFLILLVILVFIILNKERSSSPYKDYFSVQDTSSISKVFFADRTGKTISLERSKNYWILNNQFVAKQTMINILLATIKDVQVKRTLPEKSIKNVIRDMATTGVKVEIYSDEKLLKTYTIGSPTLDYLGNYMLLDGASEPYIVHIPYLNGFLTPRYGIPVNTLYIDSWRSTKLLTNNNIFSIKFNNIKNPNASFSINKDSLKLFDYKGNVVQGNKKKIVKYIDYWYDLHCEAFKKNDDKINQSLQLYEIVINNDTLRIYEMIDIDKKMKKDNFNVARMYANINNQQLMLIQNYVFNKVLINIEELKN